VTARLASLSPRAQAALVAGALLLVAVVGYFAVIAPKRSTAADLKKQTAAVQAQIDSNKSTAFTQALPAVRAASVFKLAEAMPSQLDTPDVILQLNQLAESSGIAFDQIQPGTAGASASVPDTVDPFAAEPIQVQFTGSFYNLLAFLQRLRNLVRVENGNLFTAGRLFDVTDVTFAAGEKGFPQVQATLNISAFVPQTPASTATTPGATDTTSTTTTGTTTTTSNPTSAAPSTSGGTS
jgi:Tfp pilus assembly protein PilO